MRCTSHSIPLCPLKAFWVRSYLTGCFGCNLRCCSLLPNSCNLNHRRRRQIEQVCSCCAYVCAPHTRIRSTGEQHRIIITSQYAMKIKFNFNILKHHHRRKRRVSVPKERRRRGSTDFELNLGSPILNYITNLYSANETTAAARAQFNGIAAAVTEFVAASSIPPQLSRSLIVSIRARLYCVPQHNRGCRTKFHL